MQVWGRVLRGTLGTAAFCTSPMAVRVPMSAVAAASSLMLSGTPTCASPCVAPSPKQQAGDGVYYPHRQVLPVCESSAQRDRNLSVIGDFREFCSSQVCILGGVPSIEFSSKFRIRLGLYWNGKYEKRIQGKIRDRPFKFAPDDLRDLRMHAAVISRIKDAKVNTCNSRLLGSGGMHLGDHPEHFCIAQPGFSCLIIANAMACAVNAMCW